MIENVKSVDLLRPRKVAYPWTGKTHFKVAPDAQNKSVFRTSARVEAHREIFAEHVTIPLCPLGRVIRKLQLTAIWTPKTLTLCE